MQLCKAVQRCRKLDVVAEAETEDRVMERCKVGRYDELNVLSLRIVHIVMLGARAAARDLAAGAGVLALQRDDQDMRGHHVPSYCPISVRIDRPVGSVRARQALRYREPEFRRRNQEFPWFSGQVFPTQKRRFCLGIGRAHNCLCKRPSYQRILLVQSPCPPIAPCVPTHGGGPEWRGCRGRLSRDENGSWCQAVRHCREGGNKPERPQSSGETTGRDSLPAAARPAPSDLNQGRQSAHSGQPPGR